MNAHEIIAEIAEHNEKLAAIRAALEDGAALADMGIGDADQDGVEAAHALILEWIKAGQVGRRIRRKLK